MAASRNTAKGVYNRLDYNNMNENSAQKTPKKVSKEKR